MAKQHRSIFILLIISLLFTAQVFGQTADVVTTANMPVSLTLAAPEGAAEPLTFIIDALPLHGQIAGEAPNLEYMPNPNYVGDDAITYSVVDGAGIVTSQTLTIAVEGQATGVDGVGDNGVTGTTAPGEIETEQLYEVAEGETLDIDLVVGEGYDFADEPDNGELSGQVPTLSYTPDEAFQGIDSFSYSVTINETVYEIDVTVRVGQVDTFQSFPSRNAPEHRRLNIEGVSSVLAQIVRTDNINQLRQTDNLLVQRALTYVEGSSVQVTIRTNGDVAQAQTLVENAGGTVLDVVDPYIMATVPLAALESLGATEVILHIDVPQELIPMQEDLSPMVGSVNTQGLIFSNASVWHAANFRGQGVKIGVTDIGFDSRSASELPCVQEVLLSPGNPYPNNAGADTHGTAVLEIICDMAPYAQVYAIQTTNDLAFSQGVNYLVNTIGVDVISASIGSETLAGDGSDVFSVKVDQVTQSHDVFFGVAAGNQHVGHYEGPFTPMSISVGNPPQNITVHDFNTTATQDWGNDLRYNGSFNVTAGAVICKSLIWNDWGGDVTSDYDLYLYRHLGSGNWDLVSSSINDNIISGAPVENICLYAPATGEYAFMIGEYIDPGRTVWLQLVNSNDNIQLQHQYAYSSVTAPGAALRAFSVAAANVSSAALRGYSGRGPANGRTSEGGVNPFSPSGYFHPKLTGPTDVNTSVIAGFNGTSAATPHVSGAAALVRGAFPTYTRTDTENFLINRASMSPRGSDPGAAGPDNSFGYGYLWLGNPPPVSCDADTPGIYRASDRKWYLRYSNTTGFADSIFIYGNPSDKSIIGDWNGDGIDTVGIFRNGRFYLRNSNSAGFADVAFDFGAVSDIPVAGDWNGDGIDTVGLYRPSEGRWYLKNSNSAGAIDLIFNYGPPNSTPLTGDWDGDGIDSVGIRIGNQWYLRNSNNPGVANISLTYGPTNARPIVGDWNGDCVDTIGVHTGNQWLLRNTNSSGGANLNFRYGLANETPVAGTWAN